MLVRSGIVPSFVASGEALGRRLADDWTIDVVILDLGLADSGLALRLGAGGPRLLAFGNAVHAGLALAANLADFIPGDPGDAELIAAIERATAPVPPRGVADLSDRTTARLGALGVETERVAAALARLGAEPPQAAPISVTMVRALIRARRARDRFLPADIFGEPAWDMLLDLIAARLEARAVSVSSLCIAAAVPTTTALRCIRSLCDAGMLVRRDDPDDARRAFIALSEPTATAMAAYLATFAAG